MPEPALPAPIRSAPVVLLPDAGPLITLAYADALELLFKPGWPVLLVDMVLHEITRNQMPTSDKLAHWAAASKLPVLATQTFQHHPHALAAQATRTTRLGELAIQETMTALALEQTAQTGVFLFEDHKIARAGFFVPDNCRKASTRAFLLFLQQQGWLESAVEIERRAIQAGRSFSALRFPPAP
ncbi:MAG: hypothetical protein HKL99_16485 [Burkholderiales bacterium]|jgi:hypothetical protein|nr:hypothetical protein [Burkholderiales bacterium]